MTAQGSAYTRLRRALDRSNVLEALSAASELEHVGLVEALELTLLLRDHEPSKFQRAALRWHGRYCREVPGVTFEEAQAGTCGARDAQWRTTEGRCRGAGGFARSARVRTSRRGADSMDEHQPLGGATVHVLWYLRSIGQVPSRSLAMCLEPSLPLVRRTGSIAGGFRRSPFWLSARTVDLQGFSCSCASVCASDTEVMHAHSSAPGTPCSVRQLVSTVHHLAHETLHPVGEDECE